ncbi:FmdE family protein [uncultured Christiangramia sp.]|uniref:FmdE family protein n=1 Tax=uncultured Christiangramia sp. TaxID=503836 RepID=UPI003458A4E8
MKYLKIVCESTCNIRVDSKEIVDVITIRSYCFRDAISYILNTTVQNNTVIVDHYGYECTLRTVPLDL